MKLKDFAPWKKSYDQPRKHIEKQRHSFANKGLSSQSYGFSSSHVWIWELEDKESWVLKNWCFWTVVLEKTLENPLDGKEIPPVHPKGSQSWIFIGRTDAEVEAPIILASWCEELSHLKRPWCWERLKVRGEGDDRGWDGWMASPTQWTWVWVSSGSWWWTGRPCLLQTMVSERVGHDWVTELNWTMRKGFPGVSGVKNLPANAGDAHSISVSGRSYGERSGYPLQYSCLENSMARGAWWAIIYGVAKSLTWLGN